MRFPKRAAVLLLLVLVTALLVGSCGGSKSTRARRTTTTTLTPPVTLASVSVHYLVGTRLHPSDQSPAEVAKAIGERRPLVILFYVAGGTDDDAVRDALKKLQGKYPDVVFLYYDYRDARAYGDLANLVKVDYPPQVVMTDPKGMIRFTWTGYADEGTLNQGVVNVRQG